MRFPLRYAKLAHYTLYLCIVTLRQRSSKTLWTPLSTNDNPSHDIDNIITVIINSHVCPTRCPCYNRQVVVLQISFSNNSSIIQETPHSSIDRFLIRVSPPHMSQNISTKLWVFWKQWLLSHGTTWFLIGSSQLISWITFSINCIGHGWNCSFQLAHNSHKCWPKHLEVSFSNTSTSYKRS